MILYFTNSRQNKATFLVICLFENLFQFFQLFQIFSIFQVKKVMNNVFFQLKNEFEPSSDYSGSDVVGTILNVVRVSIRNSMGMILVAFHLSNFFNFFSIFYELCFYFCWLLSARNSKTPKITFSFKLLL